MAKWRSLQNVPAFNQRLFARDLKVTLIQVEELESLALMYHPKQSDGVFSDLRFCKDVLAVVRITPLENEAKIYHTEKTISVT